MVILDLWGISFHAVVVFGLGKNLLFKSILGRCVFLFFFLDIYINIFFCIWCKKGTSPLSNCKDIYKLCDMIFLVLIPNAFLSEDLLRRKSIECLVNLKGQNCKKGTTETFNYIFRWDFFFNLSQTKAFCEEAY